MEVKSLLGEKLQTGNGSKSVSDLKNRVVALYFSASWCPPCHAFTPQLVKFYEKMKEQEKDFEVVFVSSDHDAKSMGAYFEKMPWLAVPFDEREVKAKLSTKLKVRGIPTLVFLDGPTGQVYNMNGREVVMTDPDGENYPWIPPSLAQCLGTEFVRNDGTKVTIDELEGKYITIAFSAHWCPPCQAFTPKLINVYKKLTEAGKPWEVIYVSSDRDEQQFKEYFGTMPWLAIPFSDRKRKEELSSFFEVEGIPTSIMLNPDMNVINAGLRAYVEADPEGAEFPWEPSPVLSLDQGAADINDMPALLILMEDEKQGTVEQFKSILSKIAEPFKEKVKEQKADPMLFLFANEAGNISQRVRQLCKLENMEDTTRTLCNGDMCMKLHSSTAVIILDIPDQGGFYELSGELTSENITKFYQDFLGGNLKSQRKQLG